MIKIVSQLPAGFGSLVESFTPCQLEPHAAHSLNLNRSTLNVSVLTINE